MILRHKEHLKKQIHVEKVRGETDGINFMVNVDIMYKPFWYSVPYCLIKCVLCTF